MDSMQMLRYKNFTNEVHRDTNKLKGGSRKDSLRSQIQNIINDSIWLAYKNLMIITLSHISQIS